MFPGLAVARFLADETPEVRITFAGSGKEFERRHVTEAGFEYVAFRCRSLPRRLRDVWSFLTANRQGYREAGRFLTTRSVSVVVGLGGFASVPITRAAVKKGVPLVLLEQNVVPGRATRWLAPSAKLVCTAFEQTRLYLHSHCSVRMTGNPIRPHFWRLRGSGKTVSGNGNGQAAVPDWKLKAGRDRPFRLLLILGGSGGARSLNQSLPRALRQTASKLGGWRIIHQSGESDLKPTRQLYQSLGLEATVVPFIVEMPKVLHFTDLAICRAGGTTLAELAAAAVPAILLPYPHAVDDHQRKNADVFTSAAGCLTLDERNLAGPLDDHLAAALSDLLDDAASRAAMSRSIHRLSHPDATWDVATIVRQLATSGNGGVSRPQSISG